MKVIQQKNIPMSPEVKSSFGAFISTTSISKTDIIKEITLGKVRRSARPENVQNGCGLGI
jgi:hypothetical protein